jgi:hypothetical protein
MMEALSSSETSALTRTRRPNIPEDTILHSHRRENLKSYRIRIVGNLNPYTLATDTETTSLFALRAPYLNDKNCSQNHPVTLFGFGTGAAVFIIIIIVQQEFFSLANSSLGHDDDNDNSELEDILHVKQ